MFSKLDICYHCGSPNVFRDQCSEVRYDNGIMRSIIQRNNWREVCDV